MRGITVHADTRVHTWAQMYGESGVGKRCRVTDLEYDRFLGPSSVLKELKPWTSKCGSTATFIICAPAPDR